MEAYDIVAVARATRRWPWLDPDKPARDSTRAELWNAFGVWLLATIARVAAGGGVAAAASSQITGELAAFGLGVAGPLTLERIVAAYTNPVSPANGLSPIQTLTPRSLQRPEQNNAFPSSSSDMTER